MHTIKNDATIAPIYSESSLVKILSHSFGFELSHFVRGPSSWSNRRRYLWSTVGLLWSSSSSSWCSCWSGSRSWLCRTAAFWATRHGDCRCLTLARWHSSIWALCWRGSRVMPCTCTVVRIPHTTVYSFASSWGMSRISVAIRSRLASSRTSAASPRVITWYLRLWWWRFCRDIHHFVSFVKTRRLRRTVCSGLAFLWRRAHLLSWCWSSAALVAVMVVAVVLFLLLFSLLQFNYINCFLLFLHCITNTKSTLANTGR